jgi:hypothetical protein
MNHVENTADAISLGESSCQQLESLTRRFLARMPCVSVAEMADFLARRQDLVSAIQNIDTRLENGALASAIAADMAQRETVMAYRSFRRGIIERLLELDGRIIALAGKEMDTLQENIARVMQGKQAMKGYGTCAEESRGKMERTA